VRSSFELGRIAGISIGVNWSWLVVFGLIVWSLAASVFPAQNPGLADTTYAVMAVVAAVLFFASLLLHELGHAFQARGEGLQIEGITLWLFGGVAKFRGTFPTAGAEFRIAVAGPLVSLAIGIAFVALALLAGLPSAVDGIVAWLGVINLTLLVFNLLPALPLDGGRVLRSALWALRGEFGWATRVAAGVGRAIGALMIGGGMVVFIAGGRYGGLWLSFVGWFLYEAASGEARYLATHEALRGLHVRDLMVTEPVTVPSDLTLGRFMDDVVWSRRYTTYPVVDDGKVVGLLPFRCVAQVPRNEWDARTVADCMVPREDVPQLRPDQDLADALVELGESELNRALVLDDGRLAGFLSITDVARALDARPRR
jgi:Zn-dependent protease/predicted transcriptional regulator